MSKHTKAEKKQLFIKIIAIVLCALMVGSVAAVAIPYLIALF